MVEIATSLSVLYPSAMKKVIWIGGTVVFLFVAAVIWLLSPRIKAFSTTPAFPVRTPLATARFEGGGSVQILQMGEGKIEDGRDSHPTTLWNFSSWGSSRTEIGDNDVSAYWFHSNEEPAGLRFETPFPYLILETRHLNASGSALAAQRTLLGSEVVRKGSDRASFQGSAAMLAPAADPTELPDYLIQLADGHGGWINGSGPFTNEKDPEGRAAIWFRTWPRTLTTLKFRIISPGQTPVEVQLPNLPTKPKSLGKADTLPASRETPEFRVSIEGFFLQPRCDQPPLLGIKSRFTSKLPGTSGNEPLQFELRGVEDDTGNYAPRDYELVGDGSVVFGFPLSPDATQIQVHGQIKPTDFYSVPVSQCTMLLEGSISPDGNCFVPDAAFRRQLGVDKIDVSITHEEESSELELKLAGTYMNADLPAIEARHGKMSQWKPALFLDQSDVSCGSAEFNGLRESWSGNSSEFTKSCSWRGKLKPNQRVRFGVTASVPSTPVQFTFDRAQIR